MAEKTDRIIVQQHGIAGMLWFGAWLFTIGVLQPGFWKAVAALLLWPYYLGAALAPRLAL